MPNIKGTVGKGVMKNMWICKECSRLSKKEICKRCQKKLRKENRND